LDNDLSDTVRNVMFVFDVASGTDAKQTATFEANTDAHTAYVAAAWAIQRSWWGAPTTLDILVNADDSEYFSGSNEVNIATGHHDNKFIVAHEIGHFVMDQRTDFSLGGCGTDSHSSITKETQRCALTEGFANFYSAAAFNSTEESDCWYRAVDCESSQPTERPTRVMENTLPTPFAGFGNETDWLRTLWDMRTDGVTMSSMLDWIDTANDAGTSWSDINVYRLLNIRANAIGGSLDSNWDDYKTFNGIDHPDI
jgi:hypothetical protein